MTNEEAIALVKKHPVSVGCGVLVLGLALGIYFRSDKLPAAMAELERVSDEGQRLATNIRNATKLDEQLAALTAADQEIGQRIIRSGELAHNLQLFYKLEAETGTKLSELRQLAPAATRSGGPKGSYIPVAFAFSVQGEYAQLLGFMRGLETGGVYCRVLTANLKHADASLDRATPLRLDLSLELLGQP
jgi:hypothetical protein